MCYVSFNPVAQYADATVECFKRCRPPSSFQDSLHVTAIIITESSWSALSMISQHNPKLLNSCATKTLITLIRLTQLTINHDSIKSVVTCASNNACLSEESNYLAMGSVSPQGVFSLGATFGSCLIWILEVFSLKSLISLEAWGYCKDAQTLVAWELCWYNVSRF